MKSYRYLNSLKSGLGKGGIVEREGKVYLRILLNRDETTKDQYPLELMTATAKEDNSLHTIDYDLAISCKSAYLALRKLGLNEQGVLKKDGNGRPYVSFFVFQVKEIEELDPLVEAYFEEFDSLTARAKEEEWGKKGDLVKIYDNLVVEDGEPVYLSDGVWLNSDGSLSNL